MLDEVGGRSSPLQPGVPGALPDDPPPEGVPPLDEAVAPEEVLAPDELWLAEELLPLDELLTPDELLPPDDAVPPEDVLLLCPPEFESVGAQAAIPSETVRRATATRTRETAVRRGVEDAFIRLATIALHRPTRARPAGPRE